MIVVDPEATPYTTPVAAPTVPAAVLLLLHAPPVGASVSVIVDPAHTVVVDPPIVPADGFTVNVSVAVQPVGVV